MTRGPFGSGRALPPRPRGRGAGQPALPLCERAPASGSLQRGAGGAQLIDQVERVLDLLAADEASAQRALAVDDQDVDAPFRIHPERLLEPPLLVDQVLDSALP